MNYQLDIESVDDDSDYVYNDDNCINNLDDQTLNLLDTIQLPKNLKQLTDRLPKSNYDPRSRGNSKLSLNINQKSRKGSEGESMASGSYNKMSRGDDIVTTTDSSSGVVASSMERNASLKGISGKAQQPLLDANNNIILNRNS